MSKISIEKVTELEGHSAAVFALDQGSNPHSFFSGSGDTIVGTWNLQELKFIKAVANTPASVFSVKYIPEKNILLIGQRYGGIHVIDMNLGKEIKNITHHEKAIYDIQYSIEKNCWFALAGDGNLTIWSLDNFDLLATIHIAEENLRSIDINKDQTQFALGCSDNMIRIFDIKDFDPLKSNTYSHVADPVKVISAHKNSVFTVKYHPNGRWLVSGGRDAFLKVWDIKKQFRVVHEIPAHNFTINHLVFHPEGKYLATASRDKTIKIWDQESFELLMRIDNEQLSGHTNSVNRLLWSSYNNYLISCSDDKKIMVWNVD